MALESKEMADLALEAIEVARTTGKIRKGANEATKVAEKTKAKLVVTAKDVNPQEIIMHIPILCEEKGIPCVIVQSKEELGAAAGLEVGTTAVAITEEGDAAKIVQQIKDESGSKKEEATEEKKEE